ncbi:MAG: hypothetical protein WCR72_11090 [Bacteroidota bacterium]
MITQEQYESAMLTIYTFIAERIDESVQGRIALKLIATEKAIDNAAMKNEMVIENELLNLCAGTGVLLNKNSDADKS